MSPTSASSAAWSVDRYREALSFAAAAHAGQKVPGTELPYVTHFVAVAAEVLATISVEPVADPELAVLCALLHDTIEDTAVTHAEIRDRFGEGVAAGVGALTKNAALPKAEAMADSLRRIRAEPHAVWLVKLADRTVNLAPPPAHWSRDKIHSYAEEARTIADALGEASPHQLARLREKLASYPT